jgi:hypothetical protein
MTTPLPAAVAAGLAVLAAVLHPTSGLWLVRRSARPSKLQACEITQGAAPAPLQRRSAPQAIEGSREAHLHFHRVAAEDVAEALRQFSD